MKCLVCNADAVMQVKSNKWVETHCNYGCGSYRISTKLVEHLLSTRSGFNTSSTRSWLEQARLDNSMPYISYYDYSVSLLENS